MCVVAYLIILDPLQKNIRYILSGNNIYFSGVSSSLSMNFISQLLSNYFGIEKYPSPALFTFSKISGKCTHTKIAVIKLILLFLSPFCEVELFYPFKNYTYYEYLLLCAF